MFQAYVFSKIFSLIPFPRVGRSVPSSAESAANGGASSSAGSSLYYGQKRTGKSSLIPFPRVGKRAWDPASEKGQNTKEKETEKKAFSGLFQGQQLFFWMGKRPVSCSFLHKIFG